MLSNAYENTFEDGNWVSKLEAAMAYNVTERTIENRIKSEALRSRIGDDGKIEILIRKNIKASNSFESISRDSNPEELPPKQDSKIFESVIDENNLLKKKLDDLEAELNRTKVEHAQLIGESKGKDKLLEERERLISSKDEVIRAKDQALNAANAAVMLLENQKMPAIESKDATTQQPPSSDSKKGWLDKLMGR